MQQAYTKTYEAFQAIKKSQKKRQNTTKSFIQRQQNNYIQVQISTLLN